MPQDHLLGAHALPSPAQHRPTCLAPMTSGIIDSGSTACVASSMSRRRKRRLASRMSPAPAQVAHTTSAACRISRSRLRLTDLYLRSSAGQGTQWESAGQAGKRRCRWGCLLICLCVGYWQYTLSAVHPTLVLPARPAHPSAAVHQAVHRSSTMAVPYIPCAASSPSSSLSSFSLRSSAASGTSRCSTCTAGTAGPAGTADAR